MFIDPNVCRNTKCKHKNKLILKCDLIKCEEDWITNIGCPVPEACPYKTLHILAEQHDAVCFDCPYLGKNNK